LVANCTIANNAVTDSFGSGGGVSCYDSFVEIIDSILWGNTAVFGPQIGIGDPLESDNPFSTVMLTYTDIQGGEDDVFIGEGWGPWLIPSDTNIDEDPQFAAISATDPLKNYYLSQIAAGQLTDSPCVDAGSTTAAAVGLDTETTRTDHVVDSDEVDMGYHYDASEEVAEYSLRAGVFISDLFRHGELEVLTPSLIDPIPVRDDPNTTTFVYQFKQGTTVQLMATPDENYQVKRWIGADSGPFYYGQDNTITMTGFEEVQVEFELGVPKNLYVPEAYDTVEDAIVASRSGDRIILAPREGDPYLVSDPDGINFGGKQLVLTSIDPNDPDVVANTVIDLQGTRYNSKRALHFESGEDTNSIVEGITIRNAFTAVIGASYSISTGMWPMPFQTIPDPPPPFRALSGADGVGDSYGGAILCENGSSPTIRKCVFENCTVSGGIGGDGLSGGVPPAPGLPPGLPNVIGDVDSVSGGHSGMGEGNGYGGAIAVMSGSSPIISQCAFINNRATGGWGGIPGDAGASYNAGRYGWGGNDFSGLFYAMTQAPGTNDWLEAGNGYGSGRGGGIYVDAGCDPLIYQCTFKGNYARPGYVSEGGAESPDGNAYPEPWDADPWDANPGVRDGRDGILTDDGTLAGGAVFFAEDAENALIDCVFEENSAYDVESPAEIWDYTLGGAVYTEPDVVLDLEGCQFHENIAGALYCSTGVVLDMDGCVFTNNSTTDIEAVIVDPAIPVLPRTPRDLAGGLTVEVNANAVTQISNTRFLGNTSEWSGGAILTFSDIFVEDSSFNANSADIDGGAFYSYYDTSDLSTHTVKLDFVDCEFINNEAVRFGGAGNVKTGIINLEDCFFVQNTASSGGALYAVRSDLLMQSGLVYGNEVLGAGVGKYRTDQQEGFGGGLFALDCEVSIADARILHNSSSNTNGCGGGLYLSGGQTYKEINLLNCLIADNESGNSAGGLACRENISVEVVSCTIANNISHSTLGGGVFVDRTSEVLLSDSIVSGNTGYGIYETQDSESNSTGGNSAADYTLFYGNSAGDLFDAQTNLPYSGKSELETLPQPGYTDILDGKPWFVSGPLDDYYLNQSSSPAVDAGSISAVDAMLDTMTTDSAGMPDQDELDLGYHHCDPQTIETHSLTAGVQGGYGTVTPDFGTYIHGSIVSLVADIDADYFLTGWSGGTFDDNSEEADNVVLMTGHKTIEALVQLRRTLNVGTSSEYDTLGDALDDAQDGDLILVAPGQYTAASQFPSPLNSIVLAGMMNRLYGPLYSIVTISF
jgi:predicted outer membrane repeat protein